jgi:hypothetical protein
VRAQQAGAEALAQELRLLLVPRSERREPLQPHRGVELLRARRVIVAWTALLRAADDAETASVSCDDHWLA